MVAQMALVNTNESHKKSEVVNLGKGQVGEEEVTGTEGREEEVVEGKNSQMNSIRMKL